MTKRKTMKPFQQQNIKKMESSFSFTEKLDFLQTLFYQRKNWTIEEIQQNFQSQNIYVSLVELQSLLHALRQRINLSQPDFISLKPNYFIDEMVRIHQTLSLKDISSSVFEFFISSDQHLKNYNRDQLFRAFEHCNDYCKKHHINWHFLLGDLFCLHIYSCNLINYKISDEYVQKIIQEFPNDPRIYYGLLGGNHDEDFLKLGIDPIEAFTATKENLISLGYRHSSLILGKPNNEIIFHHPNRKKLLLNNKVQHYFRSFSQAMNKSPKNVLFNFLGHCHQFQFCEDSSYCVVPSLSRDFVQNGALHVKVFFNQNGYAYKIWVLPLYYKGELIPEKPYTYVRKQK